MILNSHRNTPDLYRQAAGALGLKPGADQDEVRKAYRRAAQKLHPDQHVGEGKDALYSARFHLATAAKTLLLAKGSAGERKALDDFNKAKMSLEETMRKAGVSPTSMNADAASPRSEVPGAKPAGPEAQGGSAGHAYTYGRTRTGSAPQGATEGKTADGQTWKRRTPPPFEQASGFNSTRRETRASADASSGSAFREADWSKAKPWEPPEFKRESAWSGSRQETRASQPGFGARKPGPQPQPQPQRAQAESSSQSRTQEAPREPRFWSEENMPPVSEAFRRSFEQATAAPEAPFTPAPSPPASAAPDESAKPSSGTGAAEPTVPRATMRAAARAYEQSTADAPNRSRFDRWA